VNVGVDRMMPADGVIQIAFDRYLLPASVNRQSIAIVDGAHQPLSQDLAPVVVYDPIARTVTLYPPKQPWLTEGQPYTLLLGVPEGDADIGGVRAIDRATLAPEQTREFGFIVGPKANTPVEPTVSFCRDVLPIFASKCSLPTCHGTGGLAAASLVLDTSAGVGATALNRIAQGSNTGPLSTRPPAGQTHFGIDMPIIDPGNPGNSWLIYKVDLARPPGLVDQTDKLACSAGLLEPRVPFVFAPLVPQAQRTADDIERSILSDYILGREMPFPALSVTGYADSPLTFDEREIVRIWIKGLVPGGALPECGGCGTFTPPDGSAGDASVPETGAGDAGDAGDAGSDAADAADGD
ncbi:MAG: hypothetical protein QOI41_1639, partial [Myxococcales bacterium]|nr:hypothetical protein [Myxococcales bacterium]